MQAKRANSSKIVKKANSFLVLSTIRKFECITTENIAGYTGLSRPTVLKIIKELTDNHIVQKAGFAESEVGRSPTLYSLNTNDFFAIGVDVDGPPVHIAISDINGKLICSTTLEIEPDASVETTRNAISTAILQLMQQKDIQRESVLGIGMGLPASIDLANNRSLNFNRLSVMANEPIADLIAQDTGIPVVVRNDAHLIAKAEKMHIDPNVSDMMCIVYRSGIGMAIIINNQLYCGSTGNSGFIGHTTIDLNGKPCPCGQRGCLERYTSKQAICQRYEEATGNLLPYETILLLAEKGDKLAAEICKEAGHILGIGIANMIKVMDIRNVVIADIGCTEKHILFRSLQKSLRDNTITYFKKPCKVYSGKLKKEELALGGCNFVIDEYFVLPELVLKA